MQASWEVGLGKGFQARVSLPFDIKGSRIQYTLEDGTEYQPPYAGIHHRNETLVGLGDAVLGTRYVTAISEMSVLSLGLGLTIPLGSTEENPYLLGAESKEHQHFQFGTGVLSPRFQIAWNIRKNRFGLQTWASAQTPIYKNRKGFKPGFSAGWGISPQVKIHPRIDLFLPLEGAHLAKETWNGQQAPSSGKHALRTGLMVGVTLKRGVWLFAQGLVPVWQQSLSDNTDDQILEPFVGTLGISWAPDKPLWD